MWWNKFIRKDRENDETDKKALNPCVGLRHCAVGNRMLRRGCIFRNAV